MGSKRVAGLRGERCAPRLPGVAGGQANFEFSFQASWGYSPLVRVQFLSRGADLGMDSVPRVMSVATFVELSPAMLLNPQALQLDYRLTSKGIDPKADHA